MALNKFLFYLKKDQNNKGLILPFKKFNFTKIEQIKMKIGAHQYFSNVLNKYYSIICPQYAIHFYGLEENKRLYDKIKLKYYSPEYDLFRTVYSKLQDILIMSDFYIQEDEMPSLTLVIKNIEGDHNVEICFSISLLSNSYCFFLKVKGEFGVTYYFDPFFNYKELYERIDEVLKNILTEYINIPYPWLRYKIKYSIPGVTVSGTEDGEIINYATIFDALFFPYDFNKNGAMPMHKSSSDYNIFEMLNKSDPELIERYNFFKKVKKSELKPL
nr:hypothetical protein [Candidatus Brachybacter algidus]